MEITKTVSFYELGIVFVIVGVFILIFAAILITVRLIKKGKISAAGILVIGPVPILFGTDKKTLKTILLLSIVLTVLLIVAILIYYMLR